MNISRLVLDQVACFDHLDLRFPEGSDPDKADLQVLVGENGTGKSTILRALAQFFTDRSTELRVRLRNPDSYAELWAAGRILRLNALPMNHAGGQWQFSGLIADELVRWVDVRNVDVEAPTRPDVLAFGYGGSRRLNPPPLVGIREIDSSALDGAIGFDGPGEPDAFVQWIANAKAKEAFALQRGDLLLAGRRRESIARVERAIREVTDLSVGFEIIDQPFDVRIRQRGHLIPIGLLPDGLKSILTWCGDLLMRLDRVAGPEDDVLQREFVLFLDEIEVHLHPSWQWKVVPMMQTLFPRAQVFLATHSPFVVASAGDAWIHRLEFDGDRVVAREPLTSRVGQSYGAVLREVLGLRAQFEPDSQALLERFKELRDAVLSGTAEFQELAEAGDALRSRSGELAAIVVPELKMVQRRMQTREGAAR